MERVKYKSSVVLGKFLPLHIGHVGLIKHALSISEQVTVLICIERDEPFQFNRLIWLQNEFISYSNIRYVEHRYDGSILASSSVPDVGISKDWANVIKKVVPNVDCFISSELYGEYVANHLNIKSEIYDMDRNEFPVKATDIRTDIIQNWDDLADSVKRNLQKKIVILGTESTGKTTLVGMLKNKYGDIISVVSEAGRDYVPDSSEVEKDTLFLIMDEHNKRIHQAKENLTPIVLMDTDIHTTESYLLYCFNERMSESKYKRYFDNQAADLYFLCSPDFIEWVQDGTRMPKENRDILHIFLRFILNDRKIECVELNGGYEVRYKTACKTVDNLIKSFIE